MLAPSANSMMAQAQRYYGRQPQQRPQGPAPTPVDGTAQQPQVAAPAQQGSRGPGMTVGGGAIQSMMQQARQRAQSPIAHAMQGMQGQLPNYMRGSPLSRAMVMGG